MRKSIATVCLVALLSLGLILAVGCGGPTKPGTSSTGPGGTAGGPPGGATTSGGPPGAPGGVPSNLTGPPPPTNGPPNETNSVAVNATVSFADGTKPTTWQGSNDPRMLIFKNLQVTVDLQGETASLAGVVRDINGSYAFGTRMMVKKDPKSYKKLTKITFHAPGYKDVVLKDVPIENLFARVKDPVVMEK